MKPTSEARNRHHASFKSIVSENDLTFRRLIHFKHLLILFPGWKWHQTAVLCSRSFRNSKWKDLACKFSSYNINLEEVHNIKSFLLLKHFKLRLPKTTCFYFTFSKFWILKLLLSFQSNFSGHEWASRLQQDYIPRQRSSSIWRGCSRCLARSSWAAEEISGVPVQTQNLC